jgi:hypothetical protein
MLPLLQAGLSRASLNDYRLGQMLDHVFETNLNQVFGALALQALEVYAIPTPWLHQDTTTIALYLTFRTLCWNSEAILPELLKRGATECATDAFMSHNYLFLHTIPLNHNFL